MTERTRPRVNEDGPGAGSSGTESTALDTVLSALEGLGNEVRDEVRDDGQVAVAQCPAHPDHKPSLVIFDHDGRVGLHCRSGCEKTDIVRALGLTMGNLFATSYVYEDDRVAHRSYDAAGAKTFRQSGPAKGGGVLYRRADVVEAVAAGQPVYLVEGEKDVETLRSCGVTASTAAGGAGGVGKVDLSPLAGAHVVLIPDQDTAGEKWLTTAAGRLDGLAATVEVRRVAAGKDVTDHIEAGHTLDELAPAEVPTPLRARVRSLRVTRASEFKPRATRWLYAEGKRVFWLPLGGLSLLGGREGVGKSTIAYGIAAKITRGELPGSFKGEPRGVVIAATEDAWEQTVIPRLLACGADLDRVFRVDAETPEGLPVGLQLPEDVEGLTELIHAERVVLVLLDPLMSTVGANLDTNKDADVRRALEPMSRLAAEAQVAILGLIHVNKSQGSDLLTRLMASRAFAAVARAVLFAAADDEVPVEGVQQRETFLFGQIKNNLGPKVPHTLRYRIEGLTVAHDDELNQPVCGTRVAWVGQVESGIGEIVGRQENRSPEKETAQDRAETWLRGYLELHGESPFKAIKSAAEAAGHNTRTLQRARERTGIVRTTIGGTHNESAWSLPVSTGSSVINDNTDSTVTSSGDGGDGADSCGRGDGLVTAAPVEAAGGAWPDSDTSCDHVHPEDDDEVEL